MPIRLKVCSTHKVEQTRSNGAIFETPYLFNKQRLNLFLAFNTVDETVDNGLPILFMSSDMRVELSFLLTNSFLRINLSKQDYIFIHK